MPHYFSEPDNLAKAVTEGLIYGAVKMPKPEFHKLFDQEDEKNIFVVNYAKLIKAPFGKSL